MFCSTRRSYVSSKKTLSRNCFGTNYDLNSQVNGVFKLRSQLHCPVHFTSIIITLKPEGDTTWTDGRPDWNGVKWAPPMTS